VLHKGATRLVSVSNLYLSAPVPYTPYQSWFCNAVVRIESALSPQDLMDRLLCLEEYFGRVRGVPNAARTLDLDLLDYSGEIIREDGLELPHPRMTERAFVLYPLRDIAPDWVDPVSGKNVMELIAALPDNQHIVSCSSYGKGTVVFRPCGVRREFSPL
ncbi:MAG TPA: 2-amino-4-hydroxy-6-hydroxymethyldihydropteridine diphosphokinase, partial [Alphaproteobacteria bacterium]|nr:2-amino-4-hydroxy-6-hydroxymethyldihydropteridine diphosphokinase [Alphaproteobacteria bacterium]